MKCAMCYRQISDQHHPDCPEADGDREEWEKGYCVGFNDGYYPWYVLRHYSPSFKLGYAVGRTILEELVDQAVEKEIWR